MLNLEQISGIIALLLAFFSGAVIGPFLSGYFTRKANNLATKEDFGQLLEQTRRTTFDVERIRDSISSKSWLNQQRWSMRESRYSELLSALEKLRQSLHERLKYYDSPASMQDDSIPEQRLFKKQSQIGEAAFKAVREMIGPMAIFLPTTIQKSMEELVSTEYDLDHGSIAPFIYYDELASAVTTTYQLVLAQAREDLADD